MTTAIRPLPASRAPGTVATPLPSGPQAPGWIMLARTGTWLGHPAAPEVITPDRLVSAMRYFDLHHAAHGADVVIDYHHASVVAPQGGMRAPAAGWIQEMELRAGDTELWGRVLWTAEAACAIARRSYRYVSPVLRFGRPDRVTGEPVAMYVHSVALTNTPFLTELQALNQSAATDGGAHAVSAEGGDDMSLLENLARALDQQPEQVASRLGLDAGEEDEAVALALMANAARATEPEAEPEPPALSAQLANALGVEPDADATRVRAAIIRLKAPGAGLEAVRAQLGVPHGAGHEDICNAIGALQESRRRGEAETLVDEAVAAGRIPPAHRDFYLREAELDIEAAREVINSLAEWAPAPRGPRAAAAQEDDGLTDVERDVCRQLALSAETFLSAAESR